MDMRRLRPIVLKTKQLLVMGEAIAGALAPLAMAAWSCKKMMSSSSKLSSYSKLATLLAIGIILRALQRVLGPARRRSTHWLIQYGAMAAFYLPIPLATYALGIICSSSDMDMSIVLVWGHALNQAAMRHRENMTSYRLGDTLQHGWRHMQRLFYPMYWFYTVLTAYMNMQLSLISLVSYMFKPFLAFILLLVVTPSYTVTPLPNIEWSRLSRKLAEYMKLKARPGGDFFGHGEIKLENCIYPFEWSRDTGTHGSWIKIKDVFQSNHVGRDICLQSNHVDRDICLSYTFFNMIKRRFYGFDCAEEDDQRVRTFVLGLLADEIADENGSFTNRAFKVVEGQLSFLYEHLFTAQSSLVHCMPLVVYDVTSHHVYALALNVAVTAVTAHPNEWAGWFALLWLSIDTVLEKLQFMYYLASDWYEVRYAFRCGTESRKRLHRPESRNRLYRPESRNILYRPSAQERLAGWLPNTGLFTRHQYWQNKIGQYSLLQDYDRVLSAKKKLVVLATRFVLDENYGLIWHHPQEEDPVSLPDSVKTRVARKLGEINGRPTNGSRSLERYRDLSWTLTEDTHTDTILIWHIATCYCKMIIGGEKSPDFEVAETLSGYCAYLVAFLPELLPEHSQTSTRVLQRVLDQAQDLLGEAGSIEKSTKIQDLELRVEEGRLTAFEKGVKLGRQLKDTSMRWTVMAEFWAETMLYVAPSDNVAAHVEQLAKGGEFVTHVWALLSNAGILKQQRGAGQFAG